ncbi:YHS domain-containing protein [Spirosoma oryzae]|uniref:YHS domain-containing protein n=1 Tax=Spirosoma oryzae TaxID=1469603 RepID=A0A2T0RTN2_9BACT|nr:DJ-1/PfpI family protein [Spirosoma oryzae]PRY24546.1 YHS domain-containing protein [Spirosoma oryzae]
MKNRLLFCCLFALLSAIHSGSAQPKPPVVKPVKIAILLFPGVELLDFAGPLEVFNHMEGASVFTVASQIGPMKMMQNMLTVTPDYTLNTVPQPDILVVPGGRMEDVMADTAVVNWIRRTTAGRQLTMSVCTGTYLLGQAGLLDGKTVTTHWAATDMLRQMMPKTTVKEHTRFVDAGSLVTTAGVSAGIDGALHVVARLRGQQAAQQIARLMEYDKWEPEAGLVIGKPAKRPLTRSKLAVSQKVTSSRRKPVETPASQIDPVCHMAVDKITTADTAYYAGKYYGFCSKLCKQHFKREPAAYIKAN